MKRIVVIGAESTGKTTLAQALSGYYGEPWTPEFVRFYVDALDRPLQVEDLEPIAKGQLAIEDAGCEKAEKVVFHDTNLLSSIIYANHYFSKVIDWVNDTFLQREYTLYLLCLPDIPWTADEGQREGPETRARLHKLFKQTLDRMQLPHVEIGGPQPARVSAAVHAIDAALS